MELKFYCIYVKKCFLCLWLFIQILHNINIGVYKFLWEVVPILKYFFIYLKGNNSMFPNL